MSAPADIIAPSLFFWFNAHSDQPGAVGEALPISSITTQLSFHFDFNIKHQMLCQTGLKKKNSYR